MKIKILIIMGLVLFLSFSLCYADPTQSIPAQIADFNIDLNDGETIVTRVVDYKAGVVIWVANSKTFGLAVALAILPIEQTRLATDNLATQSTPQHLQK
jgi:selenocysteine lyase/cysteine desulfurase